MWEWLKGGRVKCVSRLSDKKIYGYGSDKPLNVAGCFNANVSVNDKCVHADFFVVEEKGQTLLVKQTTFDLDIYKFTCFKQWSEIGNQAELTEMFWGYWEIEQFSIKDTDRWTFYTGRATDSQNTVSFTRKVRENSNRIT